jgi:hypothetical protein
MPQSPESRVVSAVCGGLDNFATLQEIGREDVQEYLFGCRRPSTGQRPVCAPDAQLREIGRVMAQRVAQIASACSLNKDQMVRVFKVILESHQSCPASASSCARDRMLGFVVALNSDLAAAAAAVGQPCKWVLEAERAGASLEAVQAAQARTRACVSAAIPALDDQISSADVVAGAILVSCSAELPSELTDRSDFGSVARQAITVQVLESRQNGKMFRKAKIE